MTFYRKSDPFPGCPRLTYRDVEAADTGIPRRFWPCTFNTFPSTPATQPVIDKLQNKDDVYGEEYLFGGVYLHGPTGVGKTGLATALALSLYGDEHAIRWVFFVSVPDFLGRLSRAVGGRDQNAAELMERAKTAACLILDDLGAEAANAWSRERVYELINHRHGHQDTYDLTICTSNLSISELAEHLDARAAWRLVEMCGSTIFNLTGAPNLRDRKAKGPAIATTTPYTEVPDVFRN